MLYPAVVVHDINASLQRFYVVKHLKGNGAESCIQWLLEVFIIDVERKRQHQNLSAAVLGVAINGSTMPLQIISLLVHSSAGRWEVTLPKDVIFGLLLFVGKLSNQ